MEEVESITISGIRVVERHLTLVLPGGAKGKSGGVDKIESGVEGLLRDGR